MSGSERPKRTVKIKSEERLFIPGKWKDEEMQSLLQCIMKYGHKNFEKLKECLPEKSLINIKSFMRTVYDNAGKLSQGHENLDSWINLCFAENLKCTPWKDSIQIAQVFKSLAVDGLIENHPLPERSNGIIFTNAYRLIYQALMGYPIQPVNEPTAAFVQDTIRELTTEVTKQSDAIQNVKAFLKKNYSEKVKVEPETVTKRSNEDTNDAIPKKLKVYQRKKPKILNTTEKEVPSLKIVVEANSNDKAGSDSVKDFSLTIKGNDDQSQTVVNVAVPVNSKPINKKEEEELQQSSSYNPFKIPENWLVEPVYINLMQKTLL